jgi:hypothetical protein
MMHLDVLFFRVIGHVYFRDQELTYKVLSLACKLVPRWMICPRLGCHVVPKKIMCASV